ncbi:MAG TPA: DNA internalization-related competence protein ComEC/Rec2 [Clostridiales bacterium]|nr:DNA internalization-related competence protein ComEC/Rec2 [Clostridiales bacterium]
MIKRPLIWILASFLLGMYLAWRHFSVSIVSLLVLSLLLCIYLGMYRAKWKVVSPKDKFLWSLPFILLLGFLAMGGRLVKPALYDAFDQKTYCEVSGKISLIVQKPSGKAVYLKKNKVTLPEGDTYRCEAILVFCNEDTTASPASPAGPFDHQTNYRVGNEIAVKGTLQKFSQATNPGQFNEQFYYEIENIDFKLKAKAITMTDGRYSEFHSVLDHIKERLIKVYDTILSEKESGALVAMLLGEKYLLGDEVKTLYQQNGISHILAISGLHVSLIGMFVFAVLKGLKVPIFISTFVTIFILYCYGVLTNFSVSTNRAVVMMTIMLLASPAGKTYDMLSALSLSAFLILLQNPLQVFSAGFLLSYGAVLGIALIQPCFRQLFQKKHIILESIYVSTSAQLATAPIVIYFYYQLPLYGILVNLIILPFVTILTLTSIFAGILGVVYLPLGIFCVGGANYILKFYEWVCRVGSALPGNLVTVGKPGALQMVLYIILLVLFCWTSNRWAARDEAAKDESAKNETEDNATMKHWATQHCNKKLCLLLPLLASILLILPQSHAGLRVTILDVGQGDSIYLEHEGGMTALIDGGSTDVMNVGKYRIKPFLLSQGTDELTYVIMTHADADHINGLKELMEDGQTRIRNLVLPEISNKDQGYLEMEALAKEKKIAVSYCKAGDKIVDGDLTLFCLHPSEGVEAPDTNSYSAVFSVRYGEFDLLLTGDIGKEQEPALLRNLTDEALWGDDGPSGFKPRMEYDILKVAHHGSKNSTSDEFLSSLQPRYAFISCGSNNRYGHPHQELLERLQEAGSDTRITYEAGAIQIETDGRLMEVSGYLE